MAIQKPSPMLAVGVQDWTAATTLWQQAADARPVAIQEQARGMEDVLQSFVGVGQLQAGSAAPPRGPTYTITE